MQNKSFIKYLVVFVLLNITLFSLPSCRRAETEDIFYIAGTVWDTSWLEEGFTVDASITFGTENCIVEVFDAGGTFITYLSYYCDNNHLILAINNNLEIIEFNRSSFTWYNFPFASSSGYNLIFTRRM